MSPLSVVGLEAAEAPKRRPQRPREANRWLWLAVLALSAATAVAYGLTRSVSLDDFDSFNFARAIDHFDPLHNQPQPPGYPAYIALARLVSLAVPDHQAALTILSALCGALAVLLVGGLGVDSGARWAALPLATMPLFWLSSEMALSDVPGLTFAVLSVFLLNRAWRSAGGATVGASSERQHARPRSSFWYLVSGCAAAGVAAGVRPQDALVPLSALLFLVLPGLLRVGRRAVLLLCAGAAAFVLVCAAWALPLLRSFPDAATAWASLAGQSSYVGSTDSLFARPLTASNVGTRLAEFGSVFSAYFGGPRQAGLPAFAALACALVVLVALNGPAVRQLAVAWLAPYAVFMLLLLRPDDPRKVLPVVPPMLLLLAGAGAGWSASAGRLVRRFAAVSCVGLAAYFGWAAWPLVHALDTIPAPPEQAAAYIEQTFPPESTLVVAGSSYNAVRYRAPSFRTYLIDELDRAALDRDLASTAYSNLVVLDKEGFDAPDSFVGADTRVFQRDPLVLPKAASVWLAVYHPLPGVRAQDLVLPSSAVRIGTPEDVRYLQDGWYRPEEISDLPARWTGLQARIRFWVDRPSDATLQLVGVAYPRGQQLTVAVNGQAAATLSMVTDWAPYNMSLPATLFHAEGLNTVTLEHTMATSAYEATDGQSLDRRPLAAAYSSFQLTWR